jgi:uncharacterized protein DUF2806
MSDESQSHDNDAKPDDSPLSKVEDILGDIVTSVPAPIRKNAVKALARLMTAAVEYPAAILEGAAEQRRAEARARVMLIETSADQIAAQMRIDPAYVVAASTKFAHRVVRERINIDKIARIAADELKAASVEDKQDQEIPPISEDWLNAFEKEAANMSSEQMRIAFGKILAGEIRRPSSFSIRAVKTLGELDNRAATLFKRLCSLSISLRNPNSQSIIDARVVSIGNAGSNSLQAYGLGFDSLNVLQEYGLIIADYNSWMEYVPTIVYPERGWIPLTYNNSLWALVPTPNMPMKTQLRVRGVQLSRTGRDLLPIVDIEPNDSYFAALTKFFEGDNLKMTRVNAAQ